MEEGGLLQEHSAVAKLAVALLLVGLQIEPQEHLHSAVEEDFGLVDFGFGIEPEAEFGFAIEPVERLVEPRWVDSVVVECEAAMLGCEIGEIAGGLSGLSAPVTRFHFPVLGLRLDRLYFDWAEH